MTLNSTLFEPLIGSDLTVYLDDGTPFPLHLEKVTPTAQPAITAPPAETSDSGGHRAFSLDLKGPREPVLDSLTYPVVAGEAEPVHLFISAHAQDENATYYTIIVN